MLEEANEETLALIKKLDGLMKYDQDIDEFKTILSSIAPKVVRNITCSLVKRISTILVKQINNIGPSLTRWTKQITKEIAMGICFIRPSRHKKKIMSWLF